MSSETKAALQKQLNDVTTLSSNVNQVFAKCFYEVWKPILGLDGSRDADSFTIQEKLAIMRGIMYHTSEAGDLINTVNSLELLLKGSSVEDRLSSIIKSISLLHDDLQTRRRLRYSVLGSAATPTSEISIATRAPSRESMKMTEIPLPVSAEPLKSSGNIISSNSPNVKDTAQPLNAHTSTAKAACRPEPIPVQRTKMLSNTLDCLARIFGSKMDIPRIPYTTTAMVTWNEPWTDPSWRSRVSIEQRVLITELWQNFRVEYAHLEYNAIAATVGTKLYGLCLAGEVEEAKSLISKFKAEVAKGEVVQLSSPDDDGVKNERLVEKLKRSVKRRTWRP